MKLLGYAPRDSQREIFKSQARFLVADCGRRWGKTVTGLNWLLEGACLDGGENWWLAPIFAQSKMAFRKLLSAAKKGNGERAIRDKSISELRLQFVNDAVIHFKSADNPDNLRGEGLKRVFVDEAARVKRDVWEEVLRPAVSDTAGRVFFGSTPKGKNWFYDLWTRGQDPLQLEFKSWKFPTSDNPKVLPQDIQHARESLPADVFAQEYMAEFLENSASVLRNVKACSTATRQEPKPGEIYYAGLDLARLTDFTVLTILDSNARQVFMDRFNTIDWTVQKQRIIATCQKYKARLLVDSTGIGDPIFEDLRRAGLNVNGYKFTSESKKQLIEALMLRFDQMKISILPDDVQVNECETFAYEMGPSGSVRYSAPDGYHDDTVIALALANWGLSSFVEPRAWRA
jgi:phage FluMu gp28-like protein